MAYRLTKCARTYQGVCVDKDLEQQGDMAQSGTVYCA